MAVSHINGVTTQRRSSRAGGSASEQGDGFTGFSLPDLKASRRTFRIHIEF